MEEIIAMRRKNSPNSPTKIKELLLQISNIHFQSDKVSLKLEENENRIIELSKEVTYLKEEFEVEKQNLEKKVHESEEHNRLLLDLKEEKDNLDKTLMELDTRHKTMKKTKPSLRDQQLLETGKRKHKLYKEFTGIRWDYSAPETAIEGYITNKKDYLHKIAYKGDIDYKTIRDLSWNDIHRSTMDSARRAEDCKENQPINK